jgi:cell division protein FtsN
MAKFDRLEPRADDMPVFDGSMDEDEAEEGSRLPLLIVIALLVLAAFAGVVWLAYTQGVERGRADAPRVIVAQGTSGTKLKVYQQAAPADDEAAETDSAPPPPTPVTKDTAQPASPGLRAATAPEAAAPQSQAAAAESPPPQPTTGPPQKTASVSAAPEPPRIATHAPAPLVAPTDTETASAPPPPKVATVEETPKPVAGGSFLLQIGSYKSQDEADTAWHAFQSKHPIVGGYQSDIKQVDLGDKGVWYRLRIGSFADKDAAMALCTKLKADGASCFMAK